MNSSKMKHVFSVMLLNSGLIFNDFLLAAALPDGSYQLKINETPELFPGTNIADVGSDGAWNSSFTIGNLTAIGISNRMTDNDFCVIGPDSICRGSGVSGDGYAGTIDITVSGSTFSVNNMQVDTIFGTPGGQLAQSMPADFSVMSGTIDQTTGAMTLTPTERLGSIDGLPGFYDLPWNIDDVTTPGSTEWDAFTTGTDSNSVGSVTGAPITPVGDLNGDNLTDYNVILVAASQVGNAWGNFAGASVIEIWNIDILSQGDLTQPSVIIGVPGGTTQECSISGGSNVTMIANVSVTDPGEIVAITWFLGESSTPVASGDVVEIFIPYDTHSVEVVVDTVTFGSVSDTENITIEDTIAPQVVPAFVDSGSGEVITSISRKGKVSISEGVTDTCDPEPTTTSSIGLPTQEGDALKIKSDGNNASISITNGSDADSVTLTVIAVDASGNMSNGSTDLNMVSE